MAKKKATTEKLRFKDEHFVRIGDVFGVHRNLHQDELTYRVMDMKKLNDGWLEATLELLIDKTKNASMVHHPEAIDRFLQKNDSKIDFKKSKPSNSSSSDEMRRLIEEFERAYLGA